MSVIRVYSGVGVKTVHEFSVIPEQEVDTPPEPLMEGFPTVTPDLGDLDD